MHGVRWFLSGFICGIGALLGGALTFERYQQATTPTTAFDATIPAAHSVTVPEGCDYLLACRWVRAEPSRPAIIPYPVHDDRVVTLMVVKQPAQ